MNSFWILKVENPPVDGETPVAPSKLPAGARRILFSCFSRIFLQAFTMTFLAEWGDRSQLATIILASREVSCSCNNYLVVNFFSNFTCVLNKIGCYWSVYWRSFGSLFMYWVSCSRGKIGGAKDIGSDR